jgi:hypothetical protein
LVHASPCNPVYRSQLEFEGMKEGVTLITVVVLGAGLILLVTDLLLSL